MHRAAQGELQGRAEGEGGTWSRWPVASSTSDQRPARGAEAEEIEKNKQKGDAQSRPACLFLRFLFLFFSN
jgi:hypothetical protein